MHENGLPFDDSIVKAIIKPKFYRFALKWYVKSLCHQSIVYRSINSAGVFFCHLSPTAFFLLISFQLVLFRFVFYLFIFLAWIHFFFALFVRVHWRCVLISEEKKRVGFDLFLNWHLAHIYPFHLVAFVLFCCRPANINLHAVNIDFLPPLLLLLLSHRTIDASEVNKSADTISDINRYGNHTDNTWLIQAAAKLIFILFYVQA